MAGNGSTAVGFGPPGNGTTPPNASSIAEGELLIHGRACQGVSGLPASAQLCTHRFQSICARTCSRPCPRTCGVRLAALLNGSQARSQLEFLADARPPHPRHPALRPLSAGMSANHGSTNATLFCSYQTSDQGCEDVTSTTAAALLGGGFFCFYLWCVGVPNLASSAPPARLSLPACPSVIGTSVPAQCAGRFLLYVIPAGRCSPYRLCGAARCAVDDTPLVSRLSPHTTART